MAFRQYVVCVLFSFVLFNRLEPGYHQLTVFDKTALTGIHRGILGQCLITP